MRSYEFVRISHLVKYVRIAVRLRWDYFNDLLATFLDIDRGSILAVYGRVRKLKMNEDLMGLERHEGVINDIIFIFG